MCAAAAPVELLNNHPGARLRIIGIDPGIRTIFSGRSDDGSKCRMTLGEYRALAGLSKFQAASARWVREAGLPTLPAIRRPCAWCAIYYMLILLPDLDRFQAEYGSVRRRRWALTVSARAPAHTRTRRPHARPRSACQLTWW